MGLPKCSQESLLSHFCLDVELTWGTSPQSNRETSRTTRPPQLQAQDTSCGPNSSPLPKQNKAHHLRKAKNPFSYLKKNNSPKDFPSGEVQIPSNDSCCVLFYLQCLPVLFQHTTLGKLFADHKLCSVSRDFISPSPPPNSRPS